MYRHYYVNKNAQPTGEHEVHNEGCTRLPDVSNRQYLGYYNNSEFALKKAREFYDNVDGCYYCCPEIHTK